jgi:biopolymer transport protein ExbD
MRRLVPHPTLITRVNVTPLVDVALVLVIILLVTAPMLSVADLPVDLPQAHTREAEDERNISITVSSDGELALDTERLTSEALESRLASRLAEPGNQNVLVVIRADSGIPYGTVRELLTHAHAAGAKRMAIATRQKVEAGR